MEKLYLIFKDILFGHPNINIQLTVFIGLVLLIVYAVVKHLSAWNKELSYLRRINGQIPIWPVVKGHILKSTITQMPTGGECGTYPVFQVLYTFRVSNKEYVSSIYEFLEPLAIPEKECNKLVLKYPAGSKVNVHYNPENPEECCLRQTNEKDINKSVSDSRRVCIVFGILGILFALTSVESWLFSLVALFVSLLFVARCHPFLWKLTGNKLPLIRRLGCLS
jgi:hypothetical protein